MFCKEIFAIPAQVMLTKTMQCSVAASICSENKNLKRGATAAFLSGRNKRIRTAFIATQQRSVETLTLIFGLVSEFLIYFVLFSTRFLEMLPCDMALVMETWSLFRASDDAGVFSPAASFFFFAARSHPLFCDVVPSAL